LALVRMASGWPPGFGWGMPTQPSVLALIKKRQQDLTEPAGRSRVTAVQGSGRRRVGIRVAVALGLATVVLGRDRHRPESGHTVHGLATTALGPSTAVWAGLLPRWGRAPLCGRGDYRAGPGHHPCGACYHRAGSGRRRAAPSCHRAGLSHPSPVRAGLPLRGRTAASEHPIRPRPRAPR
jgi:hypothetical protein